MMRASLLLMMMLVAGTFAQTIECEVNGRNRNECDRDDECKDSDIEVDGDHCFCSGKASCSGNTDIDLFSDGRIICSGEDSCSGNVVITAGPGRTYIECGDGKAACKDVRINVEEDSTGVYLDCDGEDVCKDLRCSSGANIRTLCSNGACENIDSDCNVQEDEGCGDFFGEIPEIDGFHLQCELCDPGQRPCPDGGGDSTCGDIDINGDLSDWDSANRLHVAESANPAWTRDDLIEVYLKICADFLYMGWRLPRANDASLVAWNFGLNRTGSTGQAQHGGHKNEAEAEVSGLWAISLESFSPFNSDTPDRGEAAVQRWKYNDVPATQREYFGLADISDYFGHQVIWTEYGGTGDEVIVEMKWSMEVLDDAFDRTFSDFDAGAGVAAGDLINYIGFVNFGENGEFVRFEPAFFPMDSWCGYLEGGCNPWADQEHQGIYAVEGAGAGAAEPTCVCLEEDLDVCAARCLAEEACAALEYSPSGLCCTFNEDQLSDLQLELTDGWTSDAGCSTWIKA